MTPTKIIPTIKVILIISAPLSSLEVGNNDLGIDEEILLLLLLDGVTVFIMLGIVLLIYKNTNINNPAGYSIAKAGVIYMTKWLASTLAPAIRVNCVSPGGVYRGQQKKFVTQYIKKTLLNRMASEDDIVGPVIFLASNMSSYVTGENILIDGGWTIK